MALVESLSIPLGTQMPEFELSDPGEKLYKSLELKGKEGLLIAFTCNHCPYAVAVWPRLIRLAEYAKHLNINTAAINPNIHPSYPEDSPENMEKKIVEWKINFPYLIDKTQETAKKFKAQCTPDLYLFDKNNALVYHGRIDDNWQDEKKVTKEELKDALTQLGHGEKITDKQRPSIGCSIKWR